jgi:N-acetylmuramoyl-L-alanine amidase
MRLRTLIRGKLAVRFGAGFLLVLLPLVSASARIHHNDSWARKQFTKAERSREALNGRPLGERTRREYQRVIDSYRLVYLGSPASSKADPSVVATAELMVEMGRRFDDNKILRGAIDQYRFLRKEYPGSKYRFDALFTIGEIFKDDLNDPEEARSTFNDFLQRYPRNHLADDARAAIKGIDAQADEMDHAAQKLARKKSSSGTTFGAHSKANASTAASTNANTNDLQNAVGTDPAANLRRSELPRVTGVRHWSTPDYTRVAIDVEQEIKFASQRISNPDRIFFDLRDTKVASTLVGKTFDVDDGFLKKIRVAEFQPGRTRIVLEVDDLASYDAFLLPDPYRLIIDIHGKPNRGNLLARSAGNDRTGSNPTTAASHSEDSSNSDFDSSDNTAPDAASQPVVQKTQPAPARSGVHYSKSGVETDLPATETSADSKTSSATNHPSRGSVVKTTVAIKGSNRRIPKTIVDADDDTPAEVSNLDRNDPDRDPIDRNKRTKIRPDLPPAESDSTADSDAPKTAKVNSLSSSTASSSTTSSPKSAAHRKRSLSSSTAADTADLPVESREARPTAAGDRSLTRALGLKIGKIVIDAGHGGHDTGTIGPNGLLEKDVVLDVAKRLGRLLESRLGAEVIYTRRDDTFIPLETRTAIANRERADLFISVHANSSRDADARGVETYYLNFTSSPEALEVAARENAVSEKSIHELQDLVKKIALKDKIDESREFAGDVQESLYGGLALNNAGIRNRGIKKAPFIVLIGANMPSILAEISFVSNPTDERKMETSEHRQRIAESLYRGVSKYCNGLSGVKVASKIDKPEGQ